MFIKPAVGLRALAALAGAIIGTVMVPAVAAAPELAMLDSLSKGEWEIRNREEGTTSRICLRSGRELIQLRHRQGKCNQFVVDDTPGRVTVQYTCAGSGYGNTTIRKESSQLIQLESQGIERGKPFNFRGEARRVGSC